MPAAQLSAVVFWLCVVTASSLCDVGEKDERRIYVMAAEPEAYKGTYIDDEGFHAGFYKDIAQAVCAEANMDCRFMTVPWTWCLFSQPGQKQRGGVGLMDGWLDACVGYFPNIMRYHIFKFSQEFLKTPDDSYFYVKADSGYTLDDLFDNKRIGFIEGWFSDDMCVNRVLDKAIAAENAVQIGNEADLRDALINGKVDAVFIFELNFRAYLDPKTIKRIGPVVHCTLGGEAIMARKDNDVVAKWDEGFSKLVSSGRYKKLCDEANERHSKFEDDLVCI